MELLEPHVIEVQAIQKAFSEAKSSCRTETKEVAAHFRANGYGVSKSKAGWVILKAHPWRARIRHSSRITI